MRLASYNSWRNWWRYYVHQTFLSYPALTLCILNSYILTFAVFLPIMCHRWPFSLYYLSPTTHGDLHRLARNLNQHRALEAKQYLSSLDPNATLQLFQRHKASKLVDLAVGVLTVRRNHPKMEVNYLTQVMVQLHNIFMSDNDFPKKSLLICNAHAGPGLHDEVQVLDRYFPVHHRFTSNSPADAIMDPFEKAKWDYRFCLQQLIAQQPKYVLLLEDDAVPRNIMLSVVHHVLHNRILRSSSERHKQWGYLKLYHPQRWQGYAFEWHTAFELAGLALIGGTVFNLLARNCIRRTWTRKIDKVTFVIGAFYFLLTAVLIGRPHLMELRRLCVSLFSLVESPHCCFPAIVYPAHMVGALVSHLANITCSSGHPLDIAVTKFLTDLGYPGYLVEPNLVKHVGFVSATKSFSAHPEEFLI